MCARPLAQLLLAISAATLVAMASPLSALPDPVILLTPTFDEGPIGQQFLFTATLDDPDATCTTGSFQWNTNADEFAIVNGGQPSEQVAAKWYQSGLQVISVSFDGCTVPTDKAAQVQVNGCHFDTTNLILEEGESEGIGIQRLNGDAGDLTCELSFLDGTATVDADFLDPTTTLGWPGGDNSLRSVKITALADGESEDTETFDLFLKVFDDANDFVVVDQALVTVQESGTTEPVTISLAEVASVVDEGDTATVTVVRSGPASDAFFFSFAVDPVSAELGVDFDSAQPPITLIPFPAGVNQLTLAFPTVQDALIEGEEQFAVELLQASDGVLPAGNVASTVTILDDDSATVSFVEPQAEVAETEGVFELSLQRTGVGIAFEVDLVLANGTATPGADFEDISTRIHFAEGVEQLIVPLPVVPDHEVEATETVVYRLENASSGVQVRTSDGQAEAFVLRLLDSGSCAFTSRSFPGREDAEQLDVFVRRVGGTAGMRSCLLATTADSQTGSPASPDVDYIPLRTRIDFADSEQGPTTVSVTLLDDEEVEAVEEFDLVLSSEPPPTPPPAIPSSPPPGEGPDAPTVELDRATARIFSDDSDDRINGVRFTATSWTLREGRSATRILVQRVDANDRAASVSLCPIAGAGTADLTDVQFVNETVDWPAGSDENVLAFELLAVDDDSIERTELLAVELCRPSGVELLAPQRARVILVDNDIDTDTPEAPVADPTTPGLLDTARNPSVAKGPNGQRFVVWQQQTADATNRVLGAIFDRQGTVLRRPFFLSTDNDSEQINPRATRLGSRGFYAVWQRVAGAGENFTTTDGLVTVRRAEGSSTVVGRGFDDDESGEDDEEQETELSEPDEGASDPDVDSDGGGNVTATWRGDGGITGVQLGDDGVPEGPPVDLIDLVGSSDAELAMTASGDFVVAWLDSGSSGGTVLVRSFDQTAQPTTDPVTVSTAADARAPAVAISDDGEFIVAWAQPGENGLDVFAQRFTAGTANGPANRVNDQTIGDQVEPRVDLNTSGEAAVVWLSRDADGVGSRSLRLALFDSEGVEVANDLIVADDADGTTPSDADVTLQNSDLVTVVFERQDPTGQSLGVFRRDLQPSLVGAACDPTRELCVRRDRFAVSVAYEDFAGNNADAAAVPLTTDTGFFWFFNQDNVEVVVKVLDGCALTGSYWVFAAGLTNTEVQLRVDDTWSGLTRSYFSALGESFATVTDTGAFDTCDLEDPVTAEGTAAAMERLSEELSHFENMVGRLRGAHATSGAGSRGPCADDNTTLCLNQGRFATSVSWQSSQDAGSGQTTPLTDDTGTFWFFSPDNLEVIVKVLDACDGFGNFWVFAAGLTDVATTLTVTDSADGTSRAYTSELGQAFPPLIDFEAFACSP